MTIISERNFEDMSSADLQKKYDHEQASYKSCMNDMLEDARRSLNKYSTQEAQTPYSKRIIDILQNRIQQDKIALAKNGTLSYKPEQTYGDPEMITILHKAGFTTDKTQSLIDTFYAHVNAQNRTVSQYKQAKEREEREKQEAGEYNHSSGDQDPVLLSYSPDGLTVYDDPETGKEITGDKYKKKPKDIIDPHDYNTDNHGNILGIDIDPENKIGPDDSNDVIAAKHKVQLKLLNYARNHGKGAGTYADKPQGGKSRKDYNKKDPRTEIYENDQSLAALINQAHQKNETKDWGAPKLTLSSAYSKTYTTFSGEDMVVMVEIPVDEAQGVSVSRVVGQFQTISYSIHNEKTPVRNIGNMNARTYVFGPRTIAGSIVLTVFNRHWMKEMLAEYNQSAQIWNNYLTDELPPVNITISAANEYGKNAKLSLYGVTFVNEGQVMSINDLYTENTYQFFAQDIDYLSPVWKSSNKKTNKSKLPVKEADKTKPKASVSQVKGTSAAVVNSSSVQLDPPRLDEFDSFDSYIDELKKWKDDNMALWDTAYKNKRCTEKQKTDGKQSIKDRYNKLLKDAYDRKKAGGDDILS